ncbi:MAG: 50S ribosomal protein L11 methyltransferase, partial [Bacteroidota bacterium]
MFHQYTLSNHPDLHEVLVALLGDAGFDSFQETDTGLLAFGHADQHATWVTTLDVYAGQFGFTYSWEPLAEKNWNAEWESNFTPIRVGERL